MKELLGQGETPFAEKESRKDAKKAPEIEMTAPQMNLVVIRSKDLDRAREFYERIGLTFERHAHGNGPQHLASEMSSFVFEVYPFVDGQPTSESARIGFAVSNVDELIERMSLAGVEIHRRPKDSPWGRRAVVRDLDGHLVELTQILER